MCSSRRRAGGRETDPLIGWSISLPTETDPLIGWSTPLSVRRILWLVKSSCDSSADWLISRNLTNRLSCLIVGMMWMNVTSMVIYIINYYKGIVQRARSWTSGLVKRCLLTLSTFCKSCRWLPRSLSKIIHSVIQINTISHFLFITWI